MLNIRKLVGDNVRRLRFEAGLSQEELARRAGLDRTYVSGIERGTRNPTVLTLLQLSEVLGVSHVELVSPDDEGESEAMINARKLAGDNVKRLRLEKGWSQQHLSALSELSQQYLSDLENGKRNPTVTTLAQLAWVFDVEPAELLKSTTVEG